MRWRRIRLVAAALVTALALTACGGLPETSPVTEGRRLDEPITDAFRVAAQGPIEGATPEEIARGFIQAGADDDETHATAKSFLTPSTVDLWRWAASDIVVYNGPSDLTVERSADEAVKASVHPVGFVSADGRYHDALPGTVLHTTFGVTKVGGEWRLEMPRQGFGLWLDAASFDRLYTPRPVFFVAVSTHLLVPDMRWFVNSSRLPTSLARAQLEPVPSYLEGAVTTGIPKGTGLAVNSVPVDGGQAQIDLTASALDAGPVDRRAMWAQLSATLAQASVTSISISAEGTGLDLPNVGSVVTSPGELGFDYAELPSSDSVLLRSGETISRIDPGRIPEGSALREHPNAAPRAGDPAQIASWWRQLALSWDSSQVAAVAANQSQVQIWVGKHDPVPLSPFGTALTRPNYDNHGYLWIGGRDAKGAARIWATHTTTLDPRPKPAAVAVSWLGGRRVVGLKVAPDGARILVATTNDVGADVQLVLAGVTRSPDGQPVALAAPLRLAEPLTEVTDLVWLDWQSYAVLGRVAPKDALRPWIGTVGVGLDGLRAQQGQPDPSAARLAPVPNGIAVSAVGDARRIVVVTDDGKVEAKAGVSWREILPGTTDFLVPGR